MSDNGRPLLRRGVDPAKTCKTRKVDIPDSEYSVILRQLSIGQMEAIKEDVAKQLALMIVDEHGELQFTSEDEIQQLRGISHTAAAFLLQQAAELNGVSKEAAEAALKNFKASPNADSATA